MGGRRKAGSGVKFAVAGHKAIERKLRRLEPVIARKVLRKGLRDGQKVIQAEVKRGAPKGESGQLFRAIKVRAGKRKRGVIRIMTTVGEGFFKGDTFYGAFVELGTRRMRAREFMRRAFRRAAPEGMRVAVASIAAGVQAVSRGGGAGRVSRPKKG